MRFSDPKFSTLRFIFIAVVLMLLTDTYLFGGKRSYIENAKQTYYMEQEQKEAELVKVPPVRVEPEDGKDYFESGAVVEPTPEIVPEPEEKKEEVAIVPPPVIVPEIVEPGPFKGKAKIAIIIDDLGMDLRHSREVMDLPAPITLAFLPYGTKTREYAVIGKQKGHSLIIHTPMEAVDPKLNIGPMGLKKEMSDEAFEKSFNTILQTFDGYGGINNHMGSGLTQDEPAMRHLMQMLKAHDLYFVDSKTIASSVAAKVARETGVPYALRDVFLDHVESRDFVDKALIQTERLALRKGSAIAIGHPKENTIAGLKAWIPTLAAKGIELVPVKELLVRPKVIPPVEAIKEEIPPAVISAPEPAAPVQLPDQPQTQSPLPY